MGEYGYYLDGVDRYRIIDVGSVVGLKLPPELDYPDPITYPNLKEHITTLLTPYIKHTV